MNKSTDIDINLILTKSQKQMEYLQKLGDSYSSGVYRNGYEFAAWINYKPPYNPHGGTWIGYGETPTGAVEALYEQIQFYLQRNSHQ